MKKLHDLYDLSLTTITIIGTGLSVLTGMIYLIFSKLDHVLFVNIDFLEEDEMHCIVIITDNCAYCILVEVMK